MTRKDAPMTQSCVCHGSENTEIRTLDCIATALDAAVRAGNPSIADWPFRSVDIRILGHVLHGLDHPVSTFAELLPPNWADVSPQTRARIPGNPRNIHMRLVSRMRRAIGHFRPDVEPWSALQLYADLETPKSTSYVGQTRNRAHREGLRPIDIDNTWIKVQLDAGDPAAEQWDRGVFFSLVRVSKSAHVQRAGLLRADLVVPPTRRQDTRAVVLPDWLQSLHDNSDRPTRNGIDRLWRTVLHHDLQASGPEDLLALIRTGQISHDMAQDVEPITSASWSAYVSYVRRGLQRDVPDRQHDPDAAPKSTVLRNPRSPKRQRVIGQPVGQRLFEDALATLGLDAPLDVDALLTKDMWPRVAAEMHCLRHVYDIAPRTVETHIEANKRRLSAQATKPVPARLPRKVATPRPVQAKPPRPRWQDRALPIALCDEVHELLLLRGYSENGMRAMIGSLGRAYLDGACTRCAIPRDASLDQVIAHGMAVMTGTTRTDANRMRAIVHLHEFRDYREFLQALRSAGIDKEDDPVPRLFAATQGAFPLSAMSREWAWAHELSIQPCPRKTFAKAVDQLDNLHSVEGLKRYLPRERIGPLQASPLRRGKRHQHARFPLPRRIESEAAALDLDPGGSAMFEVFAGLHTLYGEARTAGIVQSGQEIGCDELLSSAVLDAIESASDLSNAALGTARTRTSPLRPDEGYATVAGRWDTLRAQARAAGLHNPKADGSGERIPGFYAVRRRARAANLGPEALTSAWASAELRKIGDNRGERSTFRQGLRLLNNWRHFTSIDQRLLPVIPIEDVLLSQKRSS